MTLFFDGPTPLDALVGDFFLVLVLVLIIRRPLRERVAAAALTGLLDLRMGLLVAIPLNWERR